MVWSEGSDRGRLVTACWRTIHFQRVTLSGTKLRDTLTANALSGSLCLLGEAGSSCVAGQGSRDSGWMTGQLWARSGHDVGVAVVKEEEKKAIDASGDAVGGMADKAYNTSKSVCFIQISVAFVCAK